MEEIKESMQRMFTESPQGDKKEVQAKVKKKVPVKVKEQVPVPASPAVQLHGNYAVEIPDELPPKEALKFVDDRGRLVDKKIPTQEDLAYWYRKKLRVVGAFVAIAGFILLLILLSATTKYASGVWEGALGIISFVIDFVLGLIPESWFAWIPSF